MRTSRSSSAASGTTFGCTPPRSTPTLAVTGPNPSCVGQPSKSCRATAARASLHRGVVTRARGPSRAPPCPCAVSRIQCAPLWAGHQPVGGRLGDDQRTARRQRGRRDRQRALAAGLLPGGQHHLHAPAVVARRRRASATAIDQRGDAGLHVAGAAADHPVAVDLGGPRVHRPVGRCRRDGVEVAGERQRRVAAGAGDVLLATGLEVRRACTSEPAPLSSSAHRRASRPRRRRRCRRGPGSASRSVAGAHFSTDPLVSGQRQGREERDDGAGRDVPEEPVAVPGVARATG